MDEKEETYKHVAAEWEKGQGRQPAGCPTVCASLCAVVALAGLAAGRFPVDPVDLRSTAPPGEQQLAMPGCPCCAIPAAAGIFILSWVVASILGRRLRAPASAAPPVKLLKGLLRGASVLSAAGVALVALLVGVLASSPDWQQRFFARLCEKMTMGPEMDGVKCAVLAGATGRVLELGPGPGYSFRCFANRTDGAIAEWVGVEPNAYFQPAIDAKREEFELPFGTSLVWKRGEELDIEPHSFDSVVGTHVLCSVGDVDAVLAQVARALKPGGKFHFLEHVSDKQGRWGITLGQRLASPLLGVIAHGCQIKPIWEALERARDARLFRALEVEHSDITTMPLPFLWPHISGEATV